MYANFTEETCTGTGATLELAGVTAGNLPFSASFADGDLVAYVVEDSGGSIKVAGIGTYVAATDDITRNDTWNYNGTVVDKNPSTNIALSGGTHTVRCSVAGDRLTSARVTTNALGNSGFYHTSDNLGKHDAILATTANRMCLVAAIFNSPRLITSFALNVKTIDAGATNTRQGIYLPDADGSPKTLLEDSGNIDVSTTGLKTTDLVTPRYLPAGLYYFAVVTDSTTVRYANISIGSTSSANQQPIGISSSANDRYRQLYQDSVTGALPNTIVGVLPNFTNLPICAGFR